MSSLHKQLLDSLKQKKEERKKERKKEASYFDQFNMTEENGLEYDQKQFTPTNVNVRT